MQSELDKSTCRLAWNCLRRDLTRSTPHTSYWTVRPTDATRTTCRCRWRGCAAMTSIRYRHELAALACATALHARLPAGPLDENTDIRDQPIVVLLEHEAFRVLGGNAVDLECLRQFDI